MRQNAKKQPSLNLTALLSVCLSLLLSPGSVFTGQEKPPKAARSDSHNPAIAAFQEGVNQYVKLHKEQEKKLPKLSQESEPEEIQKHQTALEERIRAARSNARPGDIFSPQVASFLRKMIREEFRGVKGKQMRATLTEDNTKKVPLRVNYPYPEVRAFSQVPPELLLKLPQLPEILEYRFISRHLILLDKKANLIVDFLVDAAPL